MTRRRVPFAQGAPPLADVSIHLLAEGRSCAWESSSARPGLRRQVDEDALVLLEEGRLLLDGERVLISRAERELVLEGPQSSLASLDALLRRLGGDC